MENFNPIRFSLSPDNGERRIEILENEDKSALTEVVSIIIPEKKEN